MTISVARGKLSTHIMIINLVVDLEVEIMMIVNSSEVKAAMLRLGVGTMEVTRLSGLPSKTVSNFVTADRRARVPTIIKLAQGLKVEPIKLVKE